MIGAYDQARGEAMIQLITNLIHTLLGTRPACSKGICSTAWKPSKPQDIAVADWTKHFGA
jgi:hypothetical protein